MKTITLSVDEYNSLKAKADCYDAQQKACETINNLFGGYTKIGQGIQTIPRKK